jgi:type IV pilus assembly protein PilB
VQQVNTIIHSAVEMGASDIHMEPYEHVFRVRFRLDGILHEKAQPELHNKDAIISRLKIMANLDIAEKRRPQDGRIRVESNDKIIDLRVSTLSTNFGEKIVLRILDKSALNLELDQLGFEERNLKIFRNNVHLPYGMILVTGPTGSGKTTTLYGALNELNNNSLNITTIEDPIEYQLDGINQTQINSDIGLTFSGILRSILRQDPNIIMVGEIRDKETAEIAIRAALTGHLVLSTLHTNDAPSAVARLIDMGVEPFLIASSVRLVVAQRLVRKICQHCSYQYEPESSVLKELGISDLKGNLKKGKGCEKCNQTGYKGRIALFELLEINDSVSGMMGKQFTSSELRNSVKNGGGKNLREAGIQKIIEGITTPEEVLRETFI